jgi:hypothetical protein
MSIVGIVVARVWMNIAPINVPVSEKRPPASDVPPMTTARIASSSMNNPALLASAALVFEAIIRPAMPAQNATKTYTVHVIVRARTPASRLASGLMPTASISRPSAVRRVSTAAAANTANAIRIATGSPSTKPVPTFLNSEL